MPQQLFVGGDRMDVFDFAKTFATVHGRELATECLGTLDDLAAETGRRLTQEPGNMFAWLPLMYARGVFGGQALLGPLLNDRYPQIVPETVAQAMARGAI